MRDYMMKDDEVERRIRLGEDSSLELKDVRVPGRRVEEPNARDIADEFAAAANSQGCTFLFGVDDKTRAVTGIDVDKLDVVETWARDICNDLVKPPIPASIYKLSLHDHTGNVRHLLRVDVPRSLFVHKGAHGYFYRIGSSKREMQPEMLARLFQQRSQTRMICFDEQVVATAGVSDLDEECLNLMRTSLSPKDKVEFMRKLGVIAKCEDGVLRPTVGGLLIAARHPEEHLPSAFIQAVCYRGKERDANDQLDAKDITGPLHVQIAEACSFVDRNMKVAALKTPGRMDIPQYSLHSIFEAIVNAVVHRDYSIRESKIRLHMFSDRLEIFSPGGLPNSLTIEDIKFRQFARNELICSLLSKVNLSDNLTHHLTEVLTEAGRTRFLDRRGEGVPIICDKSEKLSRRSVEYRLLGETELLLTIYAAPVDSKEWLTSIGKDLSKHGSASDSSLTESDSLQNQILSLIKSNPKITQLGIAQKLGKTRTAIAYWIKKMPNVRHVGSDRRGHWEIIQGIE